MNNNNNNNNNFTNENIAKYFEDPSLTERFHKEDDTTFEQKEKEYEKFLERKIAGLEEKCSRLEKEVADLQDQLAMAIAQNISFM